MRIVSLSPFITETICYLGQIESLVGVTHRCDFPKEVSAIRRVTRTRPGTIDLSSMAGDGKGILASVISDELVAIDELKSLKPEVVIGLDRTEELGIPIVEIKERFSHYVSPEAKLYLHSPKTLDQTYQALASIGKEINEERAGLELSQRTKAQLMDWGDNFYERTRGKKVTFLSGVEPLVLGGLWIPDMIHLTGAVSQNRFPGKPEMAITWEDIVKFRPDVIVVAISGKPVSESLRTLNYFESQKGWEDLPAVKRGEVIFTDGQSFFSRPSPRIVDAMGVLVSGIGGMESGYIAARDSFFRLRWVELHRHKLPNV